MWEQKVGGLKKLGRLGCSENNNELMCSVKKQGIE